MNEGPIRGANPQIPIRLQTSIAKKHVPWARCGRKNESSWRRRRKWWSLAFSAVEYSVVLRCFREAPWWPDRGSYKYKRNYPKGISVCSGSGGIWWSPQRLKTIVNSINLLYLSLLLWKLRSKVFLPVELFKKTPTTITLPLIAQSSRQLPAAMSFKDHCTGTPCSNWGATRAACLRLWLGNRLLDSSTTWLRPSKRSLKRKKKAAAKKAAVKAQALGRVCDRTSRFSRETFELDWFFAFCFQHSSRRPVPGREAKRSHPCAIRNWVHWRDFCQEKANSWSRFRIWGVMWGLSNGYELLKLDDTWVNFFKIKWWHCSENGAQPLKW